jgi:hypothetical protein
MEKSREWISMMHKQNLESGTNYLKLEPLARSETEELTIEFAEWLEMIN